jgi:hypothetical protein
MSHGAFARGNPARTRQAEQREQTEQSSSAFRDVPGEQEEHTPLGVFLLFLTLFLHPNGRRRTQAFCGASPIKSSGVEMAIAIEHSDQPVDELALALFRGLENVELFGRQVVLDERLDECAKIVGRYRIKLDRDVAEAF